MQIGTHAHEAYTSNGAHLATNKASSSLLKRHYARGSSNDNHTKLTGREEAFDPVLKITVADVIPRADATALVDTPVELNHNLASAMVVNKLEVINVAYLASGRTEAHQIHHHKTTPLGLQIGRLIA